jgi:hypothetical protein
MTFGRIGAPLEGLVAVAVVELRYAAIQGLARSRPRTLTLA